MRRLTEFEWLILASTCLGPVGMLSWPTSGLMSSGVERPVARDGSMRPTRCCSGASGPSSWTSRHRPTPCRCGAAADQVCGCRDRATSGARVMELLGLAPSPSSTRRSSSGAPLREGLRAALAGGGNRRVGRLLVSTQLQGRRWPLLHRSAIGLKLRRIRWRRIEGRHRYGRGQYIEVPLFEAAFEMIATFAEVPMSRGAVEDRLLERLMRDVITFHQAKDGRWIDWSSPTGASRLCSTSARPTDLLAIDEDELERVRERLESVWGERTAAERGALSARADSGACSAAVQTTAEWLNDRHALASECVVEVDDPELGPTPGWLPGAAVAGRWKVRWPRRIPDSDRHEILAELASLGAPSNATDAAEGAGERNENVLPARWGGRCFDFPRRTSMDADLVSTWRRGHQD